jgi:hypothetical protein
MTLKNLINDIEDLEKKYKKHRKELINCKINYEFESQDGGFYPVTKKPTIVTGITATQNAGSINPGIYYKISGGGINGAFCKQYKKCSNKLLEDLNKKIEDDAPEKDNFNYQNILVPIPENDCDLAEYMMYSVGPVMSGETTFTEKNKEIIKNIYRDAMDIIIKHNNTLSEKHITCFRVTFLSTGVYGPNIDNIDDKKSFMKEIIELSINSMLDRLIHDDNKHLKTLLFQETIIRDYRNLIINLFKN